MELVKKLRRVKNQVANALAQAQDHHNPEKTVTAGMPELLRRAAAEGAVLLENRVLPLAKGTKVSLFGRVQLDWFCTGYGSGGDVNAPYRVGLLEGLRKCEKLKVNEGLAEVYEAWVREHPADHGIWGRWPRSHPEMPVTELMALEAKAHSDKAVVVIGRSSGEDRENTLEEGSYYLTAQERELLKNVTSAFPDTVLVLNIGCLMDLRFVKEYPFGAVLIAWQGGMESGNALADLLCGKVNPCGRLTDTAAVSYDKYPCAGCFGGKDANEYREDIYVGYRWFETFAKEDVLYPFGHGLSYTTFSIDFTSEDPLIYQVHVTNTGKRAGRNAVLLFVEKPCGALGNPSRELVAFGKTRLLEPGETEILGLDVSAYQISSYDDSGITGHKSCYVIQPGCYRFYLGETVRDAFLVGQLDVAEEMVLQKMSEAAAPVKPFPITAAEEADGIRRAVQREASPKSTDLRKIILDNLPEAHFMTGDRGFTLKEVKQGRVPMEDFLAQLSLEELEALSRGAYIMGSPLGPKGNAGVFGGVTESLRKKGIPPVVTTDGPSGIRLYDSASLLPIGTGLACTFDPELVEDVYAAVGQEMKALGTDVLLAPGMNIHRSPLCGRNFEYFSEDPLVSGRMAAAVTRGIQSQGLSACPKHFACNNQEFRRNKNDSIVSERALREIYLKGFEICVKEAAPKNLMTSYNKINGVWGHYHYELVQTILREEWGFDGNILTDWWMQYAPSPEFHRIKSNGYRVRSRVNVLMPGSRNILDPLRKPDGTLLASYKKEDGITLGELQRNAQTILKCVMDLKEL